MLCQIFAGKLTAGLQCCGLLLLLCRLVTDEALLQLPKFPVLASLVLRGTLATNDGLKPLGSMAGLEQLDLGSKWELNDAGGVAQCTRSAALLLVV